MLFPETWRPIKDSAPRRKEFFIYLPSLQLAPVIPGREGAHDAGRETQGRFAMQNANCGCPILLNLRRADHDRDVLGRRRDLENVLDETGQIKIFPNESGVFL